MHTLTRRNGLLAALAVTAAISTSSAAFAQCTSVATGPGAGFFGPQLAAMSAGMSSAAGSFGSTLGNQNTAFLSQQGSAFVSAPADPMPDQPGGGVWARGVGGELTTKFNSVGASTVTSGPGVAITAVPPFLSPIAPGALNTNATTNCAGSVHSTFAGSQVGADISRLNVGGWNLHTGTTAGFLSSRSTDNGGGSTDIEVPFFGLYAVATKGRFFADIMVRNEFYNGRLTNQAIGLFNQELGARGVSVSTSAGYNFALANNWFIEPSAGFIWSRTNVDNVNVSGGVISNGVGSVLSTNPIESQIGRLSLRAGTTIASGNMIWQPFGSVSVFHEFAGNITSQSNAFPGTIGVACLAAPPACGIVPVNINTTSSTTRVGTYGQFSLGLAGQVANTGWLGFVRGDYKYGNNLEGWTANAGIRYQFSPERIASIMPVKVKAPRYATGPTNWTGFYVGGFAGVAYGSTDIRFVNDPFKGGNNPRVAGWLGGLQAGYNYQAAGSSWVFGVEGDVGGTNLHGTRPCTPANDNTVSAFLTCQNSSNWMVTAAARVGYSWERTLFYVKAGGAWADDNVNVGCIFGPLNGAFGPCRNPNGTPTNGFSSSGNRAGWLVGYGTEFDLGKNWSAKAEYTYMNLGERRALATDGQTTINDNGALSQVKIGVNYRFTPGGAVVAKY